MSAQNITFDLRATTAEWSKGLESAGRDVKGFVKEGTTLFKQLSFDKGVNIAGLSNFGKGLATVAGGAEDLVTKMRTGEMTTEQWGKVIEGLPLVGNFAKAANSLIEIVSGEKAAIVEAGKWAESIGKVESALNAVSEMRNRRGLRGEAGELYDAEAGNRQKMAELGAKRAEANEKIRAEQMEQEAHRSWWGTDPGEASQDKLRQAQNEAKALNAQMAELSRDGVAQKRKIEDEAEHQREILHAVHDEKINAAAEHMREISLRRQGKALESAMAHERQTTVLLSAQTMREASEAARPFTKSAEAFDKKGDATNAAKQRAIAASIMKDANDEVASLQATADAEIENLQVEDGRRHAEIENDNVEKLAEIKAKGRIEELRRQDEHLNSEAEQYGSAKRSHLAEAATIEEEYRKSIADIEKQYREENRKTSIDPNDPTLKSQREAAMEERKQRMGLLSEKSADDDAKRQRQQQETLAKDLRSAWEGTDDPMMKYQARLAGINEQFAKLHDTRLRDSQRKKASDELHHDMVKLLPDRREAIGQSDLFGWQGSTSGLRGLDLANNQKSDTAQAIESVKKLGQLIDIIAPYVPQIAINAFTQSNATSTSDWGI